jgi:chloride channel 7
VLLAVVGGWVASVFTAFNTWVCLVRKKWSKWLTFRILEARLLAHGAEVLPGGGS